MDLNNSQINTIKKIYALCNYDRNLVIEKLDSWMNDICAFIDFGDHVVNLGPYFKGWKRDDFYNLVSSYPIKRPDENKVSIAIPDGDGYYRTLVRNTKGYLMLGDKRYTSLQKLKYHNSMVPGGITVSELQNSELSWCMQFMEELND